MPELYSRKGLGNFKTEQIMLIKSHLVVLFKMNNTRNNCTCEWLKTMKKKEDISIEDEFQNFVQQK